MILPPPITSHESTWIQKCVDDTFKESGSSESQRNLVLIPRGIAFSSRQQFGIPFGQVQINWEIFRFFSYDEVRFIISHECAHIFENHNLAERIVSAIEAAVPVITNNPNTTDFIRVISSTVNLLITGHFRDISGEILRNNELQADRMA